MEKKYLEEEFYLTQRDEVEDEINIYELVDIFVRNIKTFIIICLIGSICTFAFVYKKVKYDRNIITTANYIYRTPKILGMIGSRIPVEIVTPDMFFDENKFIKELFTLKSLKKIYLKTKPLDVDDVNVQRDFIENSEIITIKQAKKEKIANAFVLKVKLNREIDRDNKISEEIIKKITDILADYYKKNINYLLEEEGKVLEDEVVALAKEVEASKIDPQLVKLYNSSANNTNNNLLYIVPRQMAELNVLSGKYSDKLNKLENNKKIKENRMNLKEIEISTSITHKIEETKTLMMLLAGVVVSILLAFAVIFSGEIIAGYKKFKSEK